MLAAGLEGQPTEKELKEVEVQMLSGTPLGRLGKLSEVADLVVYLCSDMKHLMYQEQQYL